MPNPRHEHVDRQLGVAIGIYRSDYDGRMPWMVYYNAYTGYYYRWIHVIYPNINNREIFSCPSNPVRYDTAADMDYVNDVLRSGAQKASVLARETLSKARQAVGLE